MDRNSLLRWILIAAVLLGGYYLFFGRKSGTVQQQLPQETYEKAPGFAPDAIDVQPGQPAPAPPPAGDICTIRGDRFEADLTTRGAGLTHFRLTDDRYARSAAADMSTTPDHERWHNLRTDFRAGVADDQVKYDQMDWQLERLGDKGCKFTYQDDAVSIVKTVTTDERPFELKVETTITNLTDAPKTHEAKIEAFAWRTNAEVKGHLGRVSPFQTDLECARGDDVKRLQKDAKEFDGGWYGEPLADRYAAIDNYYFGQALVPLEAAPGTGGDKPACDVLAERKFGVDQNGQWLDADADAAGDIYHARLVYPKRALQPHESATYRQIAFFGPKERAVLSHAAGGWPKLADLINLGTFSIVAKVLVEIIGWIHAHITMGNWGLAIIVMTIGLRMVLFPLTWKQIKSGIAMRKLKPEIDELNAKFKDDAQAKNLAMMELWRKNKVNPLGGCLPALVQMPIWFALYATLQTAVEFYNTKFLWFNDLSAPDQIFFGKIGILPFVIGATYIVQQRIVPQQGMDPVQQKMMMWLLPGVFTVMMLFLPAALGVYMLTNSLLGITQQLVMEKLFPRAGTPADKGKTPYRGDIVVTKEKPEKGAAATAALRKGKARV